MKVLIVDNYDSFTYNLYQFMGEILENRGESFDLKVVRNDELSYEEILKGGYDRLVISPGPGHPGDDAYFGVSARIIKDQTLRTPVLGVCLGMQGMAHHLGGRVIRDVVPMHGKTSRITHDGKGLFTGIPQNIEVMRYHSLVADPDTLPSVLEITAKVSNGDGSSSIMGVRHKDRPMEGIQFHPESFATEDGMSMLRNFLLRRD